MAVNDKDLPRIISVDDHILEPQDLWQARVQAKDRDRAPKVERHYGYIDWDMDGTTRFVDDNDKSSPNSRWVDHWVYDTMRWPIPAGFAGVANDDFDNGMVGTSYGEMRPGCYDQKARIADMDLNGVEASLCFPSMPRFCGQTFLDRSDKAFALQCLRVYNDWMIDEWCAGDGRGRLIPLTLIPLWDVELAVAEVRRCADKGSHAIAFSEVPARLGLPSAHTKYWDPLFAACEATQTVVNMHIGSSSTFNTTSKDAPHPVNAALTVQNSQAAFIDWIISGTFARFPRLRLALSEGQIGWMPYMMERLDSIWERGDKYEKDLRVRLPEPPSSYMSRIYGCIFDDVHGLKSRDEIGMSQIMFEVDYPHYDSTFPNSLAVAGQMVRAAGLNETEVWQLLRGNAIECYDLGQFGIQR
jgi:predicted TIM-barrel fold metal-dependent hydrolase